MMTRKIFECSYDGIYVIVELHRGKKNPFRIYRKWYKAGWHRKQLEKYADFNSCLIFIDGYYRSMTNVYKDFF